MISVFAVVIDLEVFITSGTLFQSLVASPMNELMIRFEEPSSISFPFVTPLVVLELSGVCCLLTLIGNFGMFRAFQTSVGLI